MPSMGLHGSSYDLPPTCNGWCLLLAWLGTLSEQAPSSWLVNERERCHVGGHQDNQYQGISSRLLSASDTAWAM